MCMWGPSELKSGPSSWLEMQMQACFLVFSSPWEIPGFAFQGLYDERRTMLITQVYLST